MVPEEAAVIWRALLELFVGAGYSWRQIELTIEVVDNAG